MPEKLPFRVNIFQLNKTAGNAICPKGPFPILKLQTLSIDNSELPKIRQLADDFEALTLSKGRSGNSIQREYRDIISRSNGEIKSL